jgi:hypothetical protein
LTRRGGALLAVSMALAAACAGSAAQAPPDAPDTIALGELSPELAVATTSAPPTTVAPTTAAPTTTTERPRRTTTDAPTTTAPPSTVPPTTAVPTSAGPPPVSPPPTTGPPTLPPTTTIPEPVDPRVLTPGAVQAVLDQLMARQQQAYEVALRVGRTAPEMVTYMRRAETEDQAVRTITGFVEFGGVDVLLDPPGRPLAQLAQLIRINQATSECLSVTSTFDLQPLTFRAIEEVEQPFDMRLVTIDPVEDPQLPWRLDWIRSAPGDTVPIEARCPVEEPEDEPDEAPGDA